MSENPESNGAIFGAEAALEKASENIPVTTEEISEKEFEALFGAAAVAARAQEANETAFDGGTSGVEAVRHNVGEDPNKVFGE